MPKNVKSQVEALNTLLTTEELNEVNGGILDVVVTVTCVAGCGKAVVKSAE